MSFISAIRQRSGLVVTIVTVSLVLFIVTSIVNDPSFDLFNRDPSVGVINGDKITRKEFDEQVALLERDYNIQNNRGPSEAERQQMRDQAWNQLIFLHLTKPQAEKLGLMVTKEELTDMVQGNNVHPAIKQAFTNPQTGQFDRAQVVNFLKNFDRYEPRQQASWVAFESRLPDDRLRTKYEALLTKTDYVTRAQSAFEYTNSLTKADFQYLFVNYASIPDSSVQVTDEELNAFLKENQFRYKAQDNRAIDYVQFMLTPSADDSSYVRNELDRLKTEFATTTDDTTYAAANSDAPVKLQTLTVNDLPKDLSGEASNLKAGQVYGPYVSGNTYTLYKVASVGAEGPFSVRASHILWKLDKGAPDSAKAAQKAAATRVLNEIKGGADFALMAAQYGTDGTAQQGGDLGWFEEGRMVKPFNDAVFNYGGTGLMPNLVESEFGYHIVKVTGAKTNVKYKVVAIQKNITPSDKTSEVAYNKAVAFKQSATDAAAFEAAAKAQNLNKISAPNVFKTGSGVNDMNEAREIIVWAYSDDSKVGEVSRVYELPDRYVVAVLTKKSEEGPAKLDDVREAVTAEVRKKKKAEQIIAKLGKGSIDEMKAKNVPGTVSNATPELLLSANASMDIGYDPEAIGRIFGAKDGATVGPFAGETGVVCVKVNKITPAPAVDPKTDLANYKMQVESRNQGRTQYYINEALKEVGKVRDDRVKVY